MSSSSIQSVFPKPSGGQITGASLLLVRAENFAILLIAVVAYSRIAGGWVMFAVLFLVPDLSISGYLAGSIWGSRVYNAAHTYLAPVLLGALGGGIGAPICVRIALIWCAHIGFDRVLGF